MTEKQITDNILQTQKKIEMLNDLYKFVKTMRILQKMHILLREKESDSDRLTLNKHLRKRDYYEDIVDNLINEIDKLKNDVR